jgi:hypothetical protein
MKQTADETKQFSGHAALMRGDSPWLAGLDLMGRESVPVVIEAVYLHRGIKFEAGRKEDKYAVKFQGKEKQMILNATNRKSLVRMFGPNTADWAGKAIHIYYDPTVTRGKETVGGIRIKQEQA